MRVSTGRILTGLCAAAALWLAGATAQAASVKYQGVFDKDDDVVLFDFTVGAGGGIVEVRNYGYGGGTMFDGTVISSGGFDNAIWLFNGDGSYTGTFDEDWDNVGSDAQGDPITGGKYDARIRRFLTAGDYVLALTQYENAPLAATDPGLSLIDGFTYDGQPHYTVALQTPFCVEGSYFCDYWVLDNGKSLLRNGNWAIEFNGVVSAGPRPSRVPLPATLPLLVAGLAGIAVARRVGRRAD